MPHRRSPQGVARNFIMQNAKFDHYKKESINTVTENQVLAKLKEEFPENPPAAEVCCPEGFEAIKGLVLDDPRGTGALTPVCRPKQETIAEFNRSQRENADK